jgi:ankyrin repeat protein
MDITNEEIFNLIKNKKFEEIYNLIKNKKIKEFDIKDNNYNYFIQYIINYNQIEIVKLILKMKESENINFRIDIIDSDGRSILYNCIKFDYKELINLLIEYNKANIGISIIDMKDRLGLTALHYSVIFNNFEAFTTLLKNKSNPYLITNDGSNVFILALMYKRNNFINYLIDNNYNLNFLTSNGDTLLQIAINYQNIEIINKLLNTNINFNNINFDLGLNVLHQSIIFDNIDLFKKLLMKNIDINMTDFYGNTPLHYIMIDKRVNFLEPFFKFENIKFNISNINGDIPLHILLDSDIVDDINQSIVNKIILESDLNIQNNQGITCLMVIITKKLLNKFNSLLVLKPLNFFIEDNNFNQIKLTDDILDILVDSYFNQIKIRKEELLEDWEKYCSEDLFEKLKKIIVDKSGAKNSETLCKNKIKDVIIKDKRSLPYVQNINLNLDNGIFLNNCFYTGSPLDILFGLYLLYQDFKSKGLNIILDYPLTINSPLENYYKKTGLDYPYKMDFSNIEIIWTYQKIFFPSYFDDEILKIMKSAKYICVPIGIETSVGSHANILFWDIKNKTVERFEPNGSHYPIGLNYNPILLDNLIENKFKQFDENISYYPPYKFLPSIGFQILENLETPKCKKIGDPNGFCGVWCTWWVYQRMLNIDNNKLSIETISEELIKWIKFDNQSFKSIIRNFSKKITQNRDIYLKKINIDINDWIVGNYTQDKLNKLEKDIFANIK